MKDESCELTERYMAETTAKILIFQNAINARQYHTE
jgi:hypothetical protein